MFKKFFLGVFILLVIAPVLFFIWWNQVNLPVDKLNRQTKTVIIPQGWGVEQIGKKLKEENLIKSVLAFRILENSRKNQSLQAGSFKLSPSMSLEKISQKLTRGTLDIWVTIPEGLRREEIAKIFFDSLTKEKASFSTSNFIKKTKNLEGFLFPDTYLIPKSASVDDIIKILNNNFLKKIKGLSLKSSLTEKQIVTLASLIEREAKHDKDRPIIAGILLKRLKEGWPLEIDATLQYIKANKKCQKYNLNCKWWPQALAIDKEIKSPFNSYKNLGLPPAPICNPGLSSIKAVIKPYKSSYWFYLSDSSGNIHYAKTLEEHEANIRKYLN